MRFLGMIIRNLKLWEMAAAVKNLIAPKSTVSVSAKAKDATRIVAAWIARTFTKYLILRLKLLDSQKREQNCNEFLMFFILVNIRYLDFVSDSYL